ncbi:MAG: hypothetical protein O7J95_05590 [Planctomycetota bacterium]|nr:hypothetical protein [Planctomycetota bacterium]
MAKKPLRKKAKKKKRATRKAPRKKATRRKAARKKSPGKKPPGTTARKPAKKAAKKKAARKKAARKKATARRSRPGKAATRALHIVKVVPGASRRELQAQWKRLYQWNQLVGSTRKLRVYCEGVSTDRPLREVTEDFRRLRGKPSLRGVVGQLVERGARLEATEDPTLHRVAGLLLRLGSLSRHLPDSRPAFEVCREIRVAFEKLNEERDRFVARRIDETLRAGEWAILYIGAEHRVEAHLPPTVDVQLLEILRWDG